MKFAFLSSHAHLALDSTAKRASGGAELQVALLARELAALGHEVVIFSAQDGQPNGGIFGGVRTRIVGRYHTGRVIDTLTAYRSVRTALREEKPDYTAILGWTAWLGLLLPSQPATKLIYICGSDAEVDGTYRKNNKLRGWLFEKGINGASQRFAMSNHQQALMRDAGLECAMYRNLLLLRNAPPTAAKDVDFLWVSRCVALKRPHLFLDLAESIPTARFEMIAPPEDTGLFAQISQRASKLPHVTLHEHVPYHAIQDHFDRAHVVVNTSEFEGYPNTFIQAGQGSATILSLHVDPDEMLSVHEAGLCAGGDWETFVEDARELHADKARCRQLQAHTATLIEAWHDNARNVRAFLEGLPR